jgi:AcrR family transcriptional regulator
MAAQKNPLESDGRAAEVFRTAAKIILQKGYDATSVSDIANALGITKAGLYHYIRGKTELLFDIMNFGLDELDREVVQPATLLDDPEERLRFIIINNARIVTRGDGAVTIVVDEARALTPAQNRKITKRKRAYFELVRATIEELEQQRKLRAVDTTVAAFNVLAMINWVSRWYQPGGRLTVSQISEQIADSALYGLLCTAPWRGLRVLRGDDE